MNSSSEQLPQAAGRSEPALSKQRLRRADELITRHIEEGKLAGAVCLVAKDNQIAHLNIQGWSHMERHSSMTEDALFRIYSMTKIITTVAVLSLYEEGLFDLNDPVAKFIPEFANQKVKLPDGRLVEAVRPTTIYDLLRHCGGLEPWDLRIDQLFKSDYTLASLAAEAGSLPLAAHPGEKWIYGYSTDVLARICEVVSGQPFDTILRQRVLEPLSMNDTFFTVPESEADRLTTCYSYSANGELGVFDPAGPESRFRGERRFLSASGGLVSSAGDYLKFASMLLNRGQGNGQVILGRKTVDLMTMDHLPSDHPNLEIGTQCFRFGLGVSVVTDVARTRCLSSLGEFGWGGAGGTQVWINPAENMVTLIMIQVRAAIPTGIMDIYKRMVYQALV